MPEGSSIINTASVNADAPSPHLLAYATTTNGRFRTSQAGSLSFWRGRASGQLRRARAGLDPLIPSTMPVETVTHFGERGPMKRPVQPPELAAIYVMLASEEASYVSGATVSVAGQTHYLARTHKLGRWCHSDFPVRTCSARCLK